MAGASAYEVPGLRFSLPAAINIDRYKFISVDSAGLAVVATASTPVVGISTNLSDAANYTDTDEVAVTINTQGIYPVEAGAAVATGIAVASNATGQAIAFTDADTQSKVGIALTSATAAGQLISVLVL